MTMYFVLSDVDKNGNIVIGRNALWSSPYNWASSSGGNDEVGPPGPDDDVVFDANSVWRRGGTELNQVIIDGSNNSSGISVCRNLTVNTGFQWDIRYEFVACALAVHGTLSLTGYAGAPITINHVGNFDTEFLFLLGTCAPMSNVIADDISSYGGKRIYYDNIGGGCTITNCPFWIHPNPPPWVSGKNYIAGDYVFNATYGHSYLCEYPNLSGSFGADYSLGYWVQADQSDLPAIPNRITVRITNAAELQLMGTAPDYDYVLQNDIDLTGFSWTPIGVSDVNDAQPLDPNPFTGSFNGQNHKISNLNYNDGQNNNYAALFGTVGSSSPYQYEDNAYEVPIFKNLTMNNFVLAGTYAIGALIGYGRGFQIFNCHVNNITINVNSSMMWQPTSIGGLAGDCYGYNLIPSMVQNCTVYGVTISALNAIDVGGLLGDCFVNPYINTSDSGVEQMLITNCFVNGISITCTPGDQCFDIGGLIGFCEATLEKCYAQGAITGVNAQSGGFIGETDSITLKDCYSRVTITTDTDSPSDIGGFIGYCSDPIASFTNAYSDGVITADASSSSVGGFIGEVDLGSNSLDNFSILNCYAVGVVTCSGTNVGGFAGYINKTGSLAIFSILNSWSYIGAFTYAIGTSYDGSTNESMTTAGYGGDETNNVRFYSPQHPVYTGLPPVSPNLEFEGSNLTFKGSQLTF